MNRSFHARIAIPAAALLAAVAIVSSASCSRAIEEDEPRELVEHRIEPCRRFCSAMHSPECGRIDEPQPFRSAEECAEDCAAVDDNEWEWGRRTDGTDACTEEWFELADCMDALTCEEQRAHFRRPPGTLDFPCKEEFDAKGRCFRTTPDLELQDGDS
jgi:hypothetical protein